MTQELDIRNADIRMIKVDYVQSFELIFSVLDPIIELAKEMSSDPTVLARMSMHRTTAAYKLTHGVYPTFHHNLTELL